MAFDFEWANANLFNNAYRRTYGYYGGSELSSEGKPVDDAEKQVLGDALAKLRPDFVDGSYRLPVSDGSGRDRKMLRQAVGLLNAKGEPFTIEFLDSSGSMGRVVAPFTQTLSKLGIQANYRVVDPSVYEKRVKSFNFEMISYRTLGQLSPGSELRRYESKYAKTEGSSNIVGIADPVVDELLTKVMEARDRKSLIVAVRSLDRVLRHGYYDVPHWYSSVHRVAYHAGLFEQPRTSPLYYQAEPWAMSTWWARSTPVTSRNSVNADSRP